MNAAPLTAPPRRTLLLTAEFLLIFAGLPLLILTLKSRALMIAILWGGALAVYLVMRLSYRQNHGAEWNAAGLRAGWKPVMRRFAVLAPLIAAGAWLAFRGGDQFLSLPRERPELWLRIMILYPLLSVWPQELIYRSFIRIRYAPLFASERHYIAASAIAFGLMHLIFLNAVAVLMTLAGGLLFAHSYSRHKSLGLACLEHALYGCLIFTVGLGTFFFSGAAWRQI